MSELINGFSSYYDSEVHLVVYGNSQEIFFPLDARVAIHRPSFSFNNKIRFLSTLKTLLYLRKEISHLSPTAVLSFGNLWNTFVLLSCLGKHQKVFISDRATPLYKAGIAQECLKRVLYPTASGIIAQTETAKEIYIRRFPKSNYAIIGNPIRNIVIPPENHREKIVISVGRLIETKHYDRLIRIFAELNRPDWTLIIVGGDAQGQNNMIKLQEQMTGLGNPTNIILAGTQKNVDSYLLRSSIFAFTSSSEGFPNAIGEAMSAGLSVVAYDCIAGPSDMIENGVNGFLVPLFDDNCFKQRLVELMDDDERRNQMGQAAKESIKEFDVDRIVDKFYQFITG